MKKRILLLGMALTAGIMLCACDSSKDADSKTRKEATYEVKNFMDMLEDNSGGTANKPTSKDPSSQDKPQSTRQEADKLDGEWVSEDVKVTIKFADTPDIEVDISEPEMHSKLMDVAVSGNVITGGLGIADDMYGDANNKNLPEQLWSITLVKNGATMSYTRNNHLTWRDDAGRIIKEKDNEKTATLTKIIKQEN